MDVQNNTRLIPMSLSLVEGKLVKAGALITMGVEADMLHDMVADKRMPVPFMIHKETYFKLEKDESEPQELTNADVIYLQEAFNFMCGASTIDDTKDIAKYGEYVENSAAILNRLKESIKP